MIQPNELRIGNWVYYGKSIRRVTAIGDSPQRKYVGVDNIITELNVIEPIPLTPERLEKCGCEKLHSELEPVAYNYKLSIPVKGENKNEIHFTIVKMGNSESWGVYTVNDHWGSNHFKYLHQLQNLYFALTGTELNYQP